jgi:hypothetical protein
MTEQEWLACTQPQSMLAYLLRQSSSQRKLKLFAIACCRRIYAWLTIESRWALEVVERSWHNQATPSEYHSAQAKAACAAFQDWDTHHPSNAVAQLFSPGYNAALASAAEAAEGVRVAALYRSFGANRGEAIIRSTPSPEAGEVALQAEQHAQCELLREIFHGPCRAVFFRCAWTTWRDGVARQMAHAIYNERAFERLPILADALEEAGCDSAELLAHLRGPGPHCRGCWALDLVLGKE